MIDSTSLISYTNPKSPVAEAYRVLRTNIQYSGIDKAVKVIVFTSSGPGEGKSTTAANLAVTFAQSGEKTLVIDCDLRKPRVHRIFGLANSKGLTNILALHDDAEIYIQKTSCNNLFVLTCGAIPPNPSELLSSNAMKAFLNKIRENYDIIILDSPPIGVVTDAAILSTIADGAILVAASGKVEVDSVRRAKDLLGKVNANIIGVVLNKLDKNAPGNNYFYNYYYYGESENDSVHKKKNRKKRKKSGDNDD